ncbi:unnamed protein product [Brassica rapa subsp. narinosa]
MNVPLNLRGDCLGKMNRFLNPFAYFPFHSMAEAQF